MKYIKNEWIKLWSQKSAWMMMAFLFIIVIGYAGISKYYEEPQGTTEQRQAMNEADIEFYQTILEDENLVDEDRVYYEQQIQLIEYRITHDLPSESATTFDRFMQFILQVSLALIGIFMVVVAASTLSKEFSTGTIKMLLTRPVARWKIALSKLATVFIYGMTVLVATLALAAIVAIILWGTDVSFSLAIVDGVVVKTEASEAFLHLLLYSLSALVVDTLLAFMLGTVFGSSNLAVAIALLISLMGNVILAMISQYGFAKYVWFANDLRQYIPGNTRVIPDLTFGFSLTVSIIYAVLFLAITLIHFQKRDITA